MKTLILTLVLSFGFAVGAQAQYQITNQVNDKKITKITDNLYNVEIFDAQGLLLQKGQYWKMGNKLLPHGEWTLFSQDSDQVITSATYNKGQQVYIETIVDGTVIRADENLIAIKRIENEIKNLEKRLATLKQN